MLDDISEKHESSYTRFALKWSLAHRDALRAMPFAEADAARFDGMAAASLEEQKHIEASDSMDFETYRVQYLDPNRLKAKRVSAGG
jgi:glutamate--cysteine ligase